MSTYLDEDYIAHMEDVLELYERPYNPRQPVVGLDEKPLTLHADLRPPIAARPEREARRGNEYERRGTANVFCAVAPKAGRHFTFATPHRSAVEFAQVAFEIALQLGRTNRGQDSGVGFGPAMANHAHPFVTLDCPPSSVEGPEALFGIHPPGTARGLPFRRTRRSNSGAEQRTQRRTRVWSLPDSDPP